MRVVVAIVTYNAASYLGECLASVNALAPAASAIVLFDNASTDGSVEIVRRCCPDARVIRSSENVGFTGGVNACMRICLDEGFDALLLLNPDADVEPELLARLSEAADRHPGAILAPAVCFRDRPGVLSTHAGSVSWWRGRSAAPLRGRAASIDDEEHRVDTASGCCLLIPVTVISRLGLLDERYFLYFEDLDYLERARREGIELWHVPSARVRHAESSATGGRGAPLATYYFARNRHYFVRKFQRGRGVYLLFLTYECVDLAARVVGFCLTGRPSSARALLRGVRDGWFGRMGRARIDADVISAAVSAHL